MEDKKLREELKRCERRGEDIFKGAFLGGFLIGMAVATLFLKLVG